MQTSIATRWGRLRDNGQGGFATLELVIITPFLLAFVLLIVGFGRVTHGRQIVEQAAAAAARVAALDSTPGQAQSDAQSEAADTLSQSGVSCHSMKTTVDTSAFHAGGQVSVTVTCVASLADLTLVGFPGHKTLTATSVSPLDQYRTFGGDGG